MTIGDVLLYAFLFFITFFAGRISMMHSIVKAVINDQDSPNRADAVRLLKIEKIDNVYYAYVDTDFAGQSNNFDDLFANMAKSRRFSEWKLAELPKELSQEERDLMRQAIEKSFTEK